MASALTSSRISDTPTVQANAWGIDSELLSPAGVRLCHRITLLPLQIEPLCHWGLAVRGKEPKLGSVSAVRKRPEDLSLHLKLGFCVRIFVGVKAGRPACVLVLNCDQKVMVHVFPFGQVVGALLNGFLYRLSVEPMKLLHNTYNWTSVYAPVELSVVVFRVENEAIG